MREEQLLLDQLPELPDLQCAWLLLAQCASPRANHALRTVPPNHVAAYAVAHDAALWDTLMRCLGGAPEDLERDARALAFLPAALGGLGLQATTRGALPAYWAGWADALPVIQARCPEAAQSCVAALEQPHASTAPCLRSAADAKATLQAEGWTDCPSWSALAGGARPNAPDENEAGLGDWPHGWQRLASQTRNLYYRDCVLLPSLTPSRQALLRSQAGQQSAAWLSTVPSEPGLTLSPPAMPIALRRRLRLPLPLAPNRCGGAGAHGCGRRIDPFGDHALACPRTGLLARRAKIVERAWVRVAREAVGPEGQVAPQQLLARTTAPGVRTGDQRRLDLVVYGATSWGGALCCDATMVSPLTREGEPHPRAAAYDGASLRHAERRKQAAYPELCGPGPQRLLVLGNEVGGRWNDQARDFLRTLTRLRGCRAPAAVRRSAVSGWARRWWGLLSVAVQVAVAETALGPAAAGLQCVGFGAVPALEAVLALADCAGPGLPPLRP